MSTALPERSILPLHQRSIDWDDFWRRYPLPDLFAEGLFKWPAERVRELQEQRFLDTVAAGWRNPFYRKRWSAAGLEPGDIRGLDDITKIPMYVSDDVQADQAAHPPYGEFHDLSGADLARQPLKLQTSGGTTGKPRTLLNGPEEWECIILGAARCLYIQGARPGDIMQIPVTCSLATLGWAAYDACRQYLGVLPLTTGTGTVTPSRRQVETAFDYGTNLWYSFPEYLAHLAHVCRDETGRDMRELNTKMIATFLGPDLDGTIRGELEALYGCPVYDRYGVHEFGLGGFECQQRDGLHWMEDFSFFEIVDVETGAPAAPGEAGMIVVTSFTRRLPPIIRYNLRDLGRIKYDTTCACGSSFRRIDHFLGRADTMVKIRGVNVYPMACVTAIRSDERTTDGWVCLVDETMRDGVRRTEMTVQVEVRRNAATRDGLQAYLERRLREDLGVAVNVELLDEGSLAGLANLAGEGKPRRLIDRRTGAAGVT